MAQESGPIAPVLSKPENFARSELSRVELAVDLAGWKPALPDGGTDESSPPDWRRYH